MKAVLPVLACSVRLETTFFLDSNFGRVVFGEISLKNEEKNRNFEAIRRKRPVATDGPKNLLFPFAHSVLIDREVSQRQSRRRDQRPTDRPAEVDRRR